jgi:hypothetical protein
MPFANGGVRLCGRLLAHSGLPVPKIFTLLILFTPLSAHL